MYGPEGTERFVDALYELFEDDIRYREWFGHGSKGIRDIDVVSVSPEFSTSTDRWSVSALPVEHSIETYAYRFTEKSNGQSCVISGDTRRIDELVEFASGADLLVQDCCLAPTATDSTFAEHIPNRLADPVSDEMREKHKQNHCDPEDAGLIAAEAGVDRLVLTHLLPNRDHDAMRKKAGTVFDGAIEVAADGMCISLDSKE